MYIQFSVHSNIPHRIAYQKCEYFLVSSHCDQAFLFENNLASCFVASIEKNGGGITEETNYKQIVWIITVYFAWQVVIISCHFCLLELMSNIHQVSFNIRNFIWNGRITWNIKTAYLLTQNCNGNPPRNCWPYSIWSNAQKCSSVMSRHIWDGNSCSATYNKKYWVLNIW